MPATTQDTVPTGEGQPAGHPLTRVPLKQSLIDAINAAATTMAPADKVVGSNSVPIVKEEGGAGATPAPAPAPTPAPPPAKAVTAPTPTPTPAPARAEPKPAEGEKPTGAPKQLREALERAESKVKEVEAGLTTTAKEKAEAYTKLAEAEGKLAKWEERFKQEYEPQLKRFSEREKRIAEVEEQLRVRDYTATPEWHNNYVKPIVETQQEAALLLGELRVPTADGGEAQATSEHFNYVLAAPSLNEAAKRAKELFGEFAAPQIVNLRTRLNSLQRKQQEALKTAQLESETWHKRQQEEQQAGQARFRSRVEAEVSKYLVKPAQEDPEEAAAFDAGRHMVSLFDNGVQDPDQLVEVVAKTRAALHSERLKDLRLERSQKRIAELEAELSGYRKSEPGVETSGGGAPEAPEDPQVGKSRVHEQLLQAARKAAVR